MRILRLLFIKRLSAVKLRCLVRRLAAASATFLAAAWTALGADLQEETKPASAFHFTVTSDLHCKSNYYNCVLDAMAANSGGQGAFQVSVGDLTDIPGQTPTILRKLIDTHFGAEAVWYPAVGNHDIRGGKESSSMRWRRDEYRTGNGSRTPLRKLIGRPGPEGTEETTYSWDYGNAHLVVLNEYWNGKTRTGSDTATDGDVVPALRDWLEVDLTANEKPFVFVFGHEPAFAEHRHVGNSLDGHAGNRDAFWDILKKHCVQVFISGHIHYYYKELHDGVWQICDGNVGQSSSEKHQTYLDIRVGADQAEIRVWQNQVKGSGMWHLAETIPISKIR